MHLIYENAAYSKSTLINKMFSNFKEYDLFTPHIHFANTKIKKIKTHNNETQDL